MVPILGRRYGLPTPNLKGVLKCEHKYRSRLEQQRATGAHPKFALADLDGDAKPPERLSFPMWFTPVKSFSSEPAFQRDTTKDLDWGGHRVPAGTGLLVFTPLFHRDAQAEPSLAPFSAGPGKRPAKNLAFLAAADRPSVRLGHRRVGIGRVQSVPD